MKSIPLQSTEHPSPTSVLPGNQASQKRFYLESFGCQMNVYDTEGMGLLLAQNGYSRVENPEEADLLLVNTCSVREHAEERTLNRLVTFTHMKKERPELIVGVTGCMAQRLGEKIKKRVPRIDLIVGARSLPAVLEGINSAEKRMGKKAYVGPEHLTNYLPAPASPTRGSSHLKGFVTIIRGCNKRCSYCIVPYTRGPEVSRTADEIVDEVQKLCDQGVVDVMLLGQNVNSYEHDGVDFPDLLHRVGGVQGLRRLRFTTSHPRDMNRDIISRIATAPRLQPWFHLPVQSGSKRVLREMNREYSLEHYLEVIDATREIIPDIALTTDIIVGHPGETQEDFDLTVSFLEQVRYDSIFAFKYSPRSGTPSADIEDDVSPTEKQRRLGHLLQLQRQISHEVNQRFSGRTLEVLIEGKDRKRGNWLSRTGHNKTLLIEEAPAQIGDFVKVKVERAEGQTLYGSYIEHSNEN